MSFTETHYVTQNGAGTRSGRNLSNAWSVSDFNSSANWSTYNSVDSKIGPGDVVYFSGTITSPLIIAGSGDASGYITFDGYEAGDQSPIVNGANPGSAIINYTSGYGLQIDAKKHLIFQDLAFTGMQGVLLRGGVIGSNEWSEYITFRRNYFYRTTNGAFQQTVQTSGGYSTTGVKYLTIGGERGQGNYFWDCKYDTIEGHVLGVNHFEDVVISYNKVVNNSATEQIGQNNIAIHKGDRILVEYNNVGRSRGQSGITCKEYGANGFIIRHNYVWECGGSGIHTNRDTYNGYVYGNYITGCNNGVGCSKDSEKIHYFSNVIANCLSNGINIQIETSGTYATNNSHFYNNTIVDNNKGTGTDGWDAGVFATYLANATDGNYFKNNIFANNAGSVSRTELAFHNNHYVELDYNCIYNSSGAPKWIWSSTGSSSDVYKLAGMQALGQETNSIVANPRITDDYKLNQDSPTIGVGATLSNPAGWDVPTIQGVDYSSEVDLSFGIDPDNTDWTTDLPTVGMLARSSVYGWDIGAYVYTEGGTPEDPPEEPGSADSFYFDPRTETVASDPISLSNFSIKNLGSAGEIDTSEIAKCHTPFGIKSWRLSHATSGARVLYFNDAPATSYHIKTLILYKASSASDSQIWPGGRISAIGDDLDGYFGGARTSEYSRITRAVDGGFTTLVDLSHGVEAAGTWIWSLFEADEDAITVKMWEYGDAEPATPQLSITDDLIATGTAGAYLWLSDGATIDIAWISCALEGDTLPVPTIWTVKQSGGDYSSLATALANASLGEYDVINIEGEWTADDTAPAAVTDTGIFINAIGASKVDPSNLSSSTHYRLRCATNGSHCFTANTSNVAFRGLEICQESTGLSDECVRNSNAGILNIYGSVLWCKTAVGMQDCVFTNTPNSTIEIENTEIFGAGRCGVNSQAPSGTTSLNINSCSIYGCAAHADFDQQKGGINILYPSGTTVYANIFNSIVMGSINLDDTDYHGDFGISTNSADRAGTAYWNIHDCIDSDGTIDLRDLAAHGCLASRTVTDNLAPGAGNWVVFKKIGTLPFDLSLANSSENDAQDMHTDASGAGMTIPLVDLVGNARPYNDYDCGAIELTSLELFNLLDGKIRIIRSALNLLDGQVAIESGERATNLLDGKVVIKKLETGLVTIEQPRVRAVSSSYSTKDIVVIEKTGRDVYRIGYTASVVTIEQKMTSIVVIEASSKPV